MLINHNYNYITKIENQLLKRGYGEVTPRVLAFERYFTEEEQQHNRSVAESMTDEEWENHCKDFDLQLCQHLKEIKECFVTKYDIHQGTKETSTNEHYQSDWDLYFWSNRDWNRKDYMTTFTLCFNERRATKDNEKLLEEVIALLKDMNYKNVACKVQYGVRFDKKSMEEEAVKVCEKLEDTMIEYCHMKGKIKKIADGSGTNAYGFFKKNAKKKYYKIDALQLLSEYNMADLSE